jgi:CHAT domain-containing protein
VRLFKRTAVVFAIIVIGSATFIGVRRGWSPSPPNELAALAAAVGSSLPFESRLSGGFVPSDRHVTRGAESTASPLLSPDARIAIAQLEKRATAEPSPQALAALGVAYLVGGELDKSVSTLEDAATEGDAATAWSDLSAAYLAKAERVPARRIEYFSRALEAATKSIRLSPSNEARFNRALAVDSLAPFVGPTNPWAEYLTAERDPLWIDTAKRHAASAASIQDARDVWDGRKQDLRIALAKGNRSAVDAIVTEFPEASTEVFEQELIVEWARGDANSLRYAKTVAAAILAATGDPIQRDEVALVTATGGTLTKAHLNYAEGLRRYDSNEYVAAAELFGRARARFIQAKSPYGAWAAAEQATILFQQRDLQAADRALAEAEQIARARRYVALLGRCLQLHGLVYSKQWRLAEALEAFRSSASIFEAAGRREDAVFVHGHLADVLRTLGEHQQSWEYIGRTLEGLARVRKPVRRYLALYNASLFASSQDLLEAALLFQNATVIEASKAGAVATVDALTQRAVIRERQHDTTNAKRDLGTAVDRLNDIPDGPLKKFLASEIGVLRRRLTRMSEGADEADLTSAIEFFDKAEPARVPGLYLERARLQRASHAEVDAEKSLELGITTLELQQSRLGDDAMKVSYFDESWSLFPEMVELQLAARRDPARAFEFAERSRARALLSGHRDSARQPIRQLGDIQSFIPPSATVLYYATLSDRVLIWRVTAASVTLVETRIARADLVRLVTRYRAALFGGRDADTIGAALYNALIRPVGASARDATLLFMPDGDLQRLPFATLRDPATHRFLIEDHGILVASSASLFVAGLERLRAHSGRPIGSALLVGNPALTQAGTSNVLKPLPGAESEVQQAAAFYTNHLVLTGPAATKQRFVASAPEYDVVHFGGHALANAEYPLLSRLSFPGSDGSDSPLFAHEISRMRFPRTRLVVLAACSTAAGAVSRGEGVASIARPFLAAGVPTVIASQWDVDDAATSQLFLLFHRALGGNQDPVKALRIAQLSLLRSNNAVLASPASWGAFVALGTTAQ